MIMTARSAFFVVCCGKGGKIYGLFPRFPQYVVVKNMGRVEKSTAFSTLSIITIIIVGVGRVEKSTDLFHAFHSSVL